MFSDIAERIEIVRPLHKNSSSTKGDQLSSVGRIREPTQSFAIDKSVDEGKRPEAEDLDASLAFTSENHGEFKASTTGTDLDHHQFVGDRESIIEEPTTRTQPEVRNPWILPTKMPKIDADNFHDPICDRFWNKTWNATAIHNVSSFKIYMSS